MLKKIIITYLFLSTVLIHAQSLDLNLSFEKLDTNGKTVAGWQNHFDRPRPISDAYEGNNAIRINVWYIGSPGYLKLGGYNGRETRGVPFTEKVKKLKGYYKYELGDNCGGKDSAEVYMFLKRFNNQTNQPDTIGRGQLYLGPTAIYTLFEVPVTYNSLNDPDTLYLEFFTQKFDLTVNCLVPENRFLTIDNLSFEYLTPTTDIEENLQLSVVPNPTNSFIQVKWHNTNTLVDAILLKDALGRTLQQKKTVNTEGVEFDLSNLPTGLYFIELNQNGKHLATRKVVKH